MTIYTVSFKKNEVYQSNLVKTDKSISEILDYFMNEKKATEVFGIGEATQDDLRPGKPIVKIWGYKTMADIKKLYIELIQDYDPFEDITEHEHLNNNQMLYNLIEIKKNNFNYIDKSTLTIYNRFKTLIDIFQALGIKPTL